MNIASFMNCCGINIAYGAYAEPENFREELKKLRTSKVYTSVAMTQMALSGGQENSYGKILLEEGWHRVVNGAHNGLHDTKIFLYVYVHRPEKSNPDLFESDF